MKVYEIDYDKLQEDDEAWNFWRLTNKFLKEHKLGHSPDKCMVCESFEMINDRLVAERNDLEVARQKHAR